MEKVEAYLLDYQEFEKIVLKHYGIEYEFPYMNECTNDTSQYYSNVTGKYCEIGEVTSQECGYDILQFMVKHNVMPSGNYIIDICW